MSATGRYGVIVAEDDTATRDLLCGQLGQAGFQVRAFSHGRAALDAIIELGTGIALADWSLPEMDGVALCRAVRELEGMQALGHIYLILLSSHTSKERTIEGLTAGANDYLTKPCHAGELLARVEVGERLLRLQEALLQRTIEMHKANAQLAVMGRKLEELANTDALTGLVNRRRLRERLEEMWRAGKSPGAVLSVILVDVDEFKRINDARGHAAGDQVLRELADAIAATAPRQQLCGRFGGEEFLLLCPGLPLDTAALLAEELRRRVAGRPTLWQDRPIAATISCGVAMQHKRQSGPEDLLREADAMLYAAKEHGRNQTWLLGEDGVPRCATVPQTVAIHSGP